MGKRRIRKSVVIMVLGIFITICISISFAMSAEKYPSKPISIVVGYAPGGATDLSSRAFAKSLEKILKQPVVVVNKPGAASAVQLQFVKNSPPDGYTLGTITTGAILNGLLKDTPYKVFEDFTHLNQYGEWLHGLVVHVDSPWKTLDEFVEYGRKNPGKLKYASMDKSTHIALMAAQFGMLNGIQWTLVVFPGDAPGVAACLGKHVDAAAVNVVGWAPFVKAGKLRALAVFESKFKEFPDIPQAIELGYKYSANFRGFVGILGPKGLPSDIRETLMNASRKAWKDPEFQSTMDIIMLPAVYKEGDEWLRFLKEYEKEGLSIMKQIELVK